MLNNYHSAASKNSSDKFGKKKKDNNFSLFLHLQGMQNSNQHIHKKRIRNFFSSLIFFNIEQKNIFFTVTS